MLNKTKSYQSSKISILARDSKGIFKLPKIKLLLPYKITWIWGISEILADV